MAITRSERDKRYRQRTKELIEKHGWKVNLEPKLLPDEDRAGLGGGLRCFMMVYQRGPDGKKLLNEPKKRCGHPAAKGSFFCKKKHGGGNQNALVHGERSMTNSAYTGLFQHKLGNLFDAFVNDPSALDCRVELGYIRTAIYKYLQVLNNPNKAIRNPKKALKLIKAIMDNKLLEPIERFAQIKQLCASHTIISDGDAVDRLLAAGDTISRICERMGKNVNKDNFILTPDGFKIFLRSMIEILKRDVPADKMMLIKDAILDISTRTGGDLSKVHEITQLKDVNNNA